jgi:hypothetical protein
MPSTAKAAREAKEERKAKARVRWAKAKEKM